MKIALFRYVAERVTTLHQFTMIAAVPEGTPRSGLATKTN